ncbi:MAG: PQQ-binding-like beta-propeller repeat protein, partial [Limisphaerales bacterium]
MVKISAILTLLAVMLSASLPANAVDVLTDMNDNNRTGANTSETILNTTNVNVNEFGKLWSYSADGAVYAQPLYVSGLSIASRKHNVIFVATMEDSVYAFDADTNSTFWHVNFTGGNITPVPVADITGNNELNIVGDVGIESTPVIDRNSSTIYLLARTKDTDAGTYIQKLHALDLATGAEKFDGPVTITNAGFDPEVENQRAGLALANGKIIIAWASHEDIGRYHGWVMDYNASTLHLVSAFDDTPTGHEGGIWQQGRAPAVDSSGNIYFITGNGSWDGMTNFGESF